MTREEEFKEELKTLLKKYDVEISIPVVFVEKLVELVIGDILNIIEDMDDGSRDSYNIAIQDVKRKIINWRRE